MQNFWMMMMMTVCVCSPVQLDDFEAFFKDMSKDSAYKFSLQFEVGVYLVLQPRRTYGGARREQP